MLIDFQVSNFWSFSEPQAISLAASAAREHFDTNTTETSDGKLRLLRSAAVYGANATGKSNLIRALRVLRNLVLRSASVPADYALPFNPFKLDPSFATKACGFEVRFIARDDVRYTYAVEFLKNVVMHESLVAYPQGRPRQLFSRNRSTDNLEKETWRLNESLGEHRNTWKAATRGNALFLSTAVQLNSSSLRPVYEWFSKNLKIYSGRQLGPHTIELCENDVGRAKVVDFLRSADLLVDSIEVKKEKFSLEHLPDDMPQPLREYYASSMQDKESVEVFILKKTREDAPAVTFELSEESNGTQRFFNLAGLWLDVLENGGVIVVDELEDSLHPNLMEHLVRSFHDPKVANAQLLYTTHNTNLMTPDLLRRDQVWFVERNRNASSELFSLAEFSLRKNQDFEARYLTGQFGAVPILRQFNLGTESRD